MPLSSRLCAGVLLLGVLFERRNAAVQGQSVEISAGAGFVYTNTSFNVACLVTGAPSYVYVNYNGSYGSSTVPAASCDSSNGNDLGDTAVVPPRGVFNGTDVTVSGCVAAGQTQNATLVIFTVAAANLLHEGAYRCSMRHKGDLIASAFTSISVRVSPKPPYFSSALAFNESDIAEVECKCEGGRPLPQLAMSTNCSACSYELVTWQLTTAEGQSSAQHAAYTSVIAMRFNATKDWQRVKVRCWVVNHNLSDLDVQEELTINYIDLIYRPSETLISDAETGNVTAYCSSYVLSYPSAVYRWLISGDVLNHSDALCVSPMNRSVSSTSTYQCIATNVVSLRNVVFTLVIKWELVSTTAPPAEPEDQPRTRQSVLSYRTCRTCSCAGSSCVCVLLWHCVVWPLAGLCGFVVCIYFAVKAFRKRNADLGSGEVAGGK